jgi:hypothetical protein
VRAIHHARKDPVQVVTDAQRPKSEDIRYRERRYLIMMGIRVLCFVAAFVMFINHAGWLVAIPAVGAIIIPYFAVVLANGGREPNGGPGFRAYTPNLPERYVPPSAGAAQGQPVQPGESGTAGSSGAPGGNGPSGHENQQ